MPDVRLGSRWHRTSQDKLLFPPAVREPEFRAEYLAVDHSRAVRGEHHVWQTWNGIDDPHRMTKV